MVPQFKVLYEVADNTQIAGYVLGGTLCQAKEEMEVGEEGLGSARLLDISELNPNLYPLF